MADDVNLGIGPPPFAPPEDPATGPGPEAMVDVGPDPLELAPEVPEPVVRGLLSTLGVVLAQTPLADADVDGHWRFTDQELDDLTPPLTRIVNARPQLRAAAARGDELTVAVQLAGYVGRNVIVGQLARRARADQEPEEWMHGDDLDRQAGGAAPAGDSGARGPGGGEQGGWVPAAPGVGVHPASA